MNNLEKKEIFLDLARKMNQKFSLIPLLHGSLGLQMLIDDELNPGDVDVAVPQVYYHLSERWQDLLDFMQSEGYELIDLHERRFRKDEIQLEFCALDGEKAGEIPSLEVFANIDTSKCPIIETDGAIYKHLTLEQYLNIYSSSSEDSYRHRDIVDNLDKDNADQIKVKMIQKALAHGTETEY